MSQKSFNLNESLDIPPDELGMGVWYSKSPDHTSKSGNWNPDASKFSVGLDIGDVGDFYGDIMLDERLQSSDSIISGNRDRSGSEVLLGTNIAKSGGPLQLFNMDTLPTNITSQLSNEMKESRKSPSRSPPRSPKSPTVCPKTGSPSLFLTGVTSSESNEYLSEYLPPTWDPQSDFCFPVAELPVARFVPDNAELCHFQDITHIADGSNANIFLALFDNEKVIIKMIREEVQTDPVAVHEFDVEHGILVRVSHPHIIKIIAAGRIPRRFVVLEFLGSGSLNSILSANIKKTTFVGKYCHRPTFGFFNLINKARDLASALDYLHKRANKGTTIIHRGTVILIFFLSLVFFSFTFLHIFFDDFHLLFLLFSSQP